MQLFTFAIPLQYMARLESAQLLQKVQLLNATVPGLYTAPPVLCSLDDLFPAKIH